MLLKNKHSWTICKAYDGKNTYSKSFNFIFRKLIRDGVAALKKYVKDFAYKLDLPYTQSRCTELYTWFLKLRADVDLIRKGGVVTLCKVTCPNNRWTYDPSACSCTCVVNNCNAATQKIDYFNCNCAADNGCALTQATCNSSDKLLDYANCVCKTKP